MLVPLMGLGTPLLLAPRPMLLLLVGSASDDGLDFRHEDGRPIGYFQRLLVPVSFRK